MNKNVTVIGIPLDLGAQNLGVDIGPNAFRHQKVEEKLKMAGLHITDTGNILCHDRNNIPIGNPKLKYIKEILRVSEKSATLTHDLIKKGQRVIALGGDHSICLGVVSGASVALKGNLGICYFDQHGDINTDQTTYTGNIHGMHLASLMGFGDRRLASVLDTSVKINKNHLLHIGGSDFDQAEVDLIKKEKLQTFTMIDLLSYGLNPVFALIDTLQSKVKNIWISLDFDVIDSMYAPGAGMPNKGGLNYREVIAIADYIGKRCNVVGIDLVEYNPLQDIEGKTAELGIELLAKFLGTNYSWYTNYMSKNKLK